MARGHVRGGSGEPQVSVVIVHRNTPVLLQQCLDALGPAAAGAAFETVIVDACSVPARRADLRARRGLTVVFNEVETTWAAAANQGADLARGENLLFLDAAVRLAPESLALLIDGLRSDAALAAVAPLIERGDGSSEPGALRFLTALNHTLSLLGWSGRRRTPIADPAPALVDADWAERRVILVRAEVFHALCGFDEGYPACEDEDWCWRARRRGYRIALARRVHALETRAAAVAHARGAFSAQLARGQLRFLDRRRRIGEVLVYRCGMSLVLLLHAATAYAARMRGKAEERRVTPALVRSLWKPSGATRAAGTGARS